MTPRFHRIYNIGWYYESVHTHQTEKTAFVVAKIKRWMMISTIKTYSQCTFQATGCSETEDIVVVCAAGGFFSPWISIAIASDRVFSVRVPALLRGRLCRTLNRFASAEGVFSVLVASIPTLLLRHSPLLLVQNRAFSDAKGRWSYVASFLRFCDVFRCSSLKFAVGARFGNPLVGNKRVFSRWSESTGGTYRMKKSHEVCLDWAIVWTIPWPRIKIRKKRAQKCEAFFFGRDSPFFYMQIRLKRRILLQRWVQSRFSSDDHVNW